MQIRRCGTLMIEPRERLEFDLSLLSAANLPGLRRVAEWTAYVPHTGTEVLLSATEIAILGDISPSAWTSFEELAQIHPIEALQSLLAKGVLIEAGAPADTRDRALREANWRPAAAVMHFASRWKSSTTEEIQQRFIEHYQADLLERLGPAPPIVRERVDRAHRLPLPRPEHTALDKLLDSRVTCRNFDPHRTLTQVDFAAVLFRAYGARAVYDYAPEVQLLKKGVPSAGALHATEAYLLIRGVDGIAPGLYHYHPVDHALEPIRELTPDEASRLARIFVGVQPYFVDAQVFVIPVSRFYRTFWKYGNHTKAYRALILDIGHLSQAMYLAATELGLAAFITAAVNEVDIEETFGLDPLEEGAMAVCGFGIRARERNEIEFDPLHAVWKED